MKTPKSSETKAGSPADPASRSAAPAGDKIPVDGMSVEEVANNLREKGCVVEERSRQLKGGKVVRKLHILLPRKRKTPTGKPFQEKKPAPTAKEIADLVAVNIGSKLDDQHRERMESVERMTSKYITRRLFLIVTLFGFLFTIIAAIIFYKNIKAFVVNRADFLAASVANAVSNNLKPEAVALAKSVKDAVALEIVSDGDKTRAAISAGIAEGKRNNAELVKSVESIKAETAALGGRLNILEENLKQSQIRAMQSTQEDFAEKFNSMQIGPPVIAPTTASVSITQTQTPNPLGEVVTVSDDLRGGVLNHYGVNQKTPRYPVFDLEQGLIRLNYKSVLDWEHRVYAIINPKNRWWFNEYVLLSDLIKQGRLFVRQDGTINVSPNGSNIEWIRFGIRRGYTDDMATFSVARWTVPKPAKTK